MIAHWAKLRPIWSPWLQPSGSSSSTPFRFKLLRHQFFGNRSNLLTLGAAAAGREIRNQARCRKKEPFAASQKKVLTKAQYSLILLERNMEHVEEFFSGE
jgi:hypothetical protein